jgi:hypothetical protein
MDFQPVAKLEIISSSTVVIAKDSKCSVSVTGTGSKKVKVRHSGDCLSIDDSLAVGMGGVSIKGGSISIGNISQAHFGDGDNFLGCKTVFTGGGNVSINSNGQNVVITNGRVYINGKFAGDNSGGQPDKEFVPLQINISVPDGLELDCKLSGCGEMSSLPEFDKLRISVSGSARCDRVSSRGKTRLSSSGCGKIYHQSLGGTLTASASGSSEIYSEGGFKDVTANASGASSIQTNGSVNGDFDGEASGTARIRHQGSVSGSKSKSSSGCGSVSIG